MKNYWLDNKKITLEECQQFHNELKWNFDFALWTTLKDKYESEYVKIIEIKSVCARKVK